VSADVLIFTCIDLEIMMQQFKYIRDTDIEPWKSTVSREVRPGPKTKTDDDIKGALATSTRKVVHKLNSL
jgi:hypothetical protein